MQGHLRTHPDPHAALPGARYSAFLWGARKTGKSAEGLTRNAPGFSRFFEAMAYSHGQLVNDANIAGTGGS